MDTGYGDRDVLLHRFTSACEADNRVVAAFLGGSLASGKADAYSDLDIYAITTDDAYDDFVGQRRAFLRLLGQPVFLEDYNVFGFDMVWFTFADGVEGELAFARESSFEHIHGGPYEVLVDKKGLLAGKTFPLYQPSEEDQLRTLRQAIYWFWEHLSHFITGMHRKQPWTAYGSLDEARMKVLKLVRLAHDFTTEQSAYSGIEQVVPKEEMLPLEATCCTLEPHAMLEAALVLVRVYRQVARELAAQHGIEYPTALESVILRRLDALRSVWPAC